MFILFRTLSLILCLAVEFFSGILYPCRETYTAIQQQASPRKQIYWMTYWVAYAVLNLAYHLIFFFPFAYEARVLLTITLAHPKVEAPDMI